MMKQTTDQTTAPNPLAWITDLVDAILDGIADEGVDLTPLGDDEPDPWDDEPEVERFAIDDEVLIDAGVAGSWSWRQPVRAEVVSTPDAGGCVCVRLLEQHGAMNPGRLMVIGTARLTKADEVPEPERTVTVLVPPGIQIATSVSSTTRGGSLTLTEAEATTLVTHINWAIDDLDAPF